MISPNDGLGQSTASLESSIGSSFGASPASTNISIGSLPQTSPSLAHGSSTSTTVPSQAPARQIDPSVCEGIEFKCLDDLTHTLSDEGFMKQCTAHYQLLRYKLEGKVPGAAIDSDIQKLVLSVMTFIRNHAAHPVEFDVCAFSNQAAE
jgi:hypothetical protein